MRLFQLLASFPTSSSSPSANSTGSDSSVSSTAAPVTVPFYSVGGFIECPWYRRAVCIADEFVRSQVERADQQQQLTSIGTASSTASDQYSSHPASPPQHLTRVQSLTFPRQQFRPYLLALSKQLDLNDHYSCPVILQGTCTLAADTTPEQRAADYPLHYGGNSGGGGGGAVTGSTVGAECRVERLVGGYAEFERVLKEQYGFVSTRCGKLARGSPEGRC